MSGGTRLENANPLIYQRSGERLLTASEEDEDVTDPIDDREIFDILAVFRNMLCSVLMLITPVLCVYVHYYVHVTHYYSVYMFTIIMHYFYNSLFFLLGTYSINTDSKDG